MTILDVKISDILEQKLLTEAEINWLINLRIPYSSTYEISTGELWAEKRRLEAIIIKAKSEGLLKEAEKEIAYTGSSPFVISDDLGVHGVLNHADGKTYDSKSAYYRAVKDAGCVVMGTDARAEAKPVEVHIDHSDICRDVKQSIEQLRGRL